MRFSIFILSLYLSLFAKEADSFITAQEYAKHLYKNPRGIGCDKCHGSKGQGTVIANYLHKGKRKVLKTESITHLNFDQFKAALEGKRGVMPKYFLTLNEIKTLYDYLHVTRK
jgi:hypothetical protein